MSDEKAEELTDEEIFVPEVEDSIWTAKPLTLRNTVILIRILAGVLARAALSWTDFFPEGQDTPTEEGLMEMLSLLDTPLLYSILSIITGATNKEIDESFTALKAVRVIADFWEQEEMNKLLGEAKRLARNQEFRERNAAG